MIDCVDCGASTLTGLCSECDTVRKMTAATEADDAEFTNCCEHGDHAAPEGRRYCSPECQACDGADSEEDDCAGICLARISHAELKRLREGLEGARRRGAESMRAALLRAFDDVYAKARVVHRSFMRQVLEGTALPPGPPTDLETARKDLDEAQQRWIAWSNWALARREEAGLQPDGNLPDDETQRAQLTQILGEFASLPHPEVVATMRAAWDAGLIAECNRQVLQQFGFALAVNLAEDGSVTGLTMLTTADPEGFIFCDASLGIIRTKLASFMAREGAALLAARERVLGYVIQPL